MTHTERWAIFCLVFGENHGPISLPLLWTWYSSGSDQRCWVETTGDLLLSWLQLLGLDATWLDVPVAYPEPWQGLCQPLERGRSWLSATNVALIQHDGRAAKASATNALQTCHSAERSEFDYEEEKNRLLLNTSAALLGVSNSQPPNHKLEYLPIAPSSSGRPIMSDQVGLLWDLSWATATPSIPLNPPTSLCIGL